MSEIYGGWNRSEVKVSFFRSYEYDGVEMRIFIKTPEGKYREVVGFETKEKEEGTWSRPIAIIDKQHTAEIVGSLKLAGLVAKGREDKGVEIDALKKHLTDMQAIVSKELDVKLGGEDG